MGVKIVIPNKTRATINGIAVEFHENLHCEIVDAQTMDQAAEFCHVAGLKVDLSHYDEDKGVNVTYSGIDAARIETGAQDATLPDNPASPEPVAEPVLQPEIEVPEKKKPKTAE